MIQKIPALAWQTAFLFAIDSLTNVTDYAFHVFLGRALLPADFAIVQTLNAVLLVVTTTFGLLQPVVARYVAEAEAVGQLAEEQGIFQHYFGLALFWGAGLIGLAWLLRPVLADWLHVPVAAVAISTTMLLMALLRPVITGVLQGRQRFVSLGLTRTTFALSRFAIGLLLLALWPTNQVLAAIASLPIGFALSLLAGLAFLGRGVWQPGRRLSDHSRRQGGRLSLAAFVAYSAFMSLQSLDLIWVNRLFANSIAGSYATAVLLRRALALLPGAIIVIMYPRAVAQVARRQMPDRLLLNTAALIALSTLLLSGLYHVGGATLIRLTFGANYMAAVAWLGWMGLAMVGYGLASVWLNFYLATRPGPFLWLLSITAGLQFLTLARYHATLNQILLAFGAAGWLLAIGGLLLYIGWFRPNALQHQIDRKIQEF